MRRSFKIRTLIVTACAAAAVLFAGITAAQADETPVGTPYPAPSSPSPSPSTLGTNNTPWG
jgi:hypothetical protein